jgi:hypothetical protein
VTCRLWSGVAAFEPAAPSSRTERAEQQNRRSSAFLHVRASWAVTITASDRVSPQLAEHRCSHSAPTADRRHTGMFVEPRGRVCHITERRTALGPRDACHKPGSSGMSLAGRTVPHVSRRTKRTHFMASYAVQDRTVTELTAGRGRGPGGPLLSSAEPTGHCQVPRCDEQIDPSRLMCRVHWYRVPKQLRDRMWATWQSGRGASSSEHHSAVRLAVAASSDRTGPDSSSSAA